MKNIWKIPTACLKSKADENINLTYRNLHKRLLNEKNPFLFKILA